MGELWMRLAKTFEGQGPFLVLQVSAKKFGDTAPGFKGYLLVDAQQRTAGVRIVDEKPDDLKPTGSLVSIIRKHAPTAGLGGVTRDKVSGDFWLPLFTSGSKAPQYFIHLRLGTPPEVRFVEAGGDALARKSSQGSFTKRRPNDVDIPSWPLDATRFEDHASHLFGDVQAPGIDEEAGKIGSEGGHSRPPSAGDAEVQLPDYQRVARDRLARRLKTVRKSLAKMSNEAPTQQKLNQATLHAALLKANLFRIKEGDVELVVHDDEGEEHRLELDPDASPGLNLERAYDALKRLKRAESHGRERGNEAARDVKAMESALSSLRRAPMPLVQVEETLKKFRLPLSTNATRNAAGLSTQEATPFRTFRVTVGEDMTYELLVGKSAEGSDELVKASKSHDLWLHAVGVTGSHVLIPARQIKGGAAPAGLIRAGAILAVHHSRFKGDLAGEVYLAHRRNLRKKKGMPAGLWQIDKAETLFIRYEAAEIEALLAQLVP